MKTEHHDSLFVNDKVKSLLPVFYRRWAAPGANADRGSSSCTDSPLAGLKMPTSAISTKTCEIFLRELSTCISSFLPSVGLDDALENPWLPLSFTC